jgi:NADP-dependent 3-hydroxy acid dehydrogenase YdfG
MISNLLPTHKYPYQSEMQNIRGKAVVIIDDAGGIGCATAALLAEKGAKIFFAAQTPADLNAFLLKVGSVGGDVGGIVVDLSSPEGIQWFFEQAEARLGRIDVLVNHQAFSMNGAPISRQNLYVQEAMARMPGSGSGHIINVGLPAPASPLNVIDAGFIPVTGPYKPRAVSAALRRKASELGIRVTSIEPGAGRAEFSAGSQSLADEDIARCVYESLIQPHGIDVIVMKGQYGSQPM